MIVFTPAPTSCADAITRDIEVRGSNSVHDLTERMQVRHAAQFHRFAFTAIVVSIIFGLLPVGTGTAQRPFVFENATRRYGLDGALKGAISHAMAVGDIDNDGDSDIYLGMYCDRPREEYVGRSAPLPNILLVNEGGKFIAAGFDLEKVAKRTSGAGFVDFDNDGDLDLYVSNNSTKAPEFATHNRLYENVDGKLRDISRGNATSIAMGGRGLGVLDYNGDGLLDLLVLEDYWRGGNTRLFKNLGNLKFADVTNSAVRLLQRRGP